MRYLSFTDFKQELSGLTGFSFPSDPSQVMALRLAYVIVYVRGRLVQSLENWDIGLNPGLRPWIYLAMGFLLFLVVILPSRLQIPSETIPKPSAVMTLSLYPSDPMPAPDTLINLSLNQLCNENESQ